MQGHRAQGPERKVSGARPREQDHCARPLPAQPLGALGTRLAQGVFQAFHLRVRQSNTICCKTMYATSMDRRYSVHNVVYYTTYTKGRVGTVLPRLHVLQKFRIDKRELLYGCTLFTSAKTYTHDTVTTPHCGSAAVVRGDASSACGCDFAQHEEPRRTRVYGKQILGTCKTHRMLNTCGPVAGTHGRRDTVHTEAF